MKYDYLIVGSGLFGSTFAWLAKQNNKKCLIIDKRDHLGGNIYCENIKEIIVHKYGPHIFHTNNKQVWEFVNMFTEFIPYTLQTMANYNGELFNLPFNMNTFYKMWGITSPLEALSKIESLKFIGVPQNLEEQALSLVGKDIYEKLIKGYTEKQWGQNCSELPTYIIKRIPVRFTYNNNYFNDLYQGIPKYGYNELINNMLDGVKYELNTDFFNILDWRKIAKKLVYTGPIDKYYNYSLGILQWRSLKFELEFLNIDNYQGVAIINYTGTEPYTRIVEHKHFSNIQTNYTIITKEYPIPFSKDVEPYYPVLYNPYNNIIPDKDVIFGGRLALYKYLDMDSTIEQAINIYNKYNE